ncbi:uncharacterized protein LOC114754419 isoform X2 [Neltuma alba]|uniref:uncharacterized protein LOC114754419 isoform X1 n=1 Tax=Neltuma alba TaxID=207710 RepID=UPI0010A519DC|nr:uncharacterized protein LOC114754419 isoform X1 [Prosopis alba]XP_028799021.1 uncharacterized protein LOC114754419 isoform X2 [Prosopis alba]
MREVSKRHDLASIQKMLLLNLGLIAQDIDDPCEGSGIIRRLLCNKKVLIILDGVNDKSQLENLAGSLVWFGRGSKIIITTRDEGLLTIVDGRCEIYKVGTLDPDESFELFCQRAFEKNEPEQGYWDLSKEIIQCVGGVPLALEFFSSFVSNGSQSELRNVLHQYRKLLPVDIFDILRISYHGLEEKCKMIFLDIACFFNGRTKFEVTDILKICYNRSIYDEIEVLIAKSLLISTELNSNSRYNAEREDLQDRIQKMRSDIFLPTSMYHKLIDEASRGSLRMFYFVEEMGRNIVYDESPSDPGSRSRLWHIEDIDRVLKRNEGTEYIQSIVVWDLNHAFEVKWHPECFSKMQNLRLLDLSSVHLAHNLNHLPRALKFLRWDFYALKHLPSIDLLHDLESLQLRSSNIRRLWNGAPELNKLRTIDLSNSYYLRETPDFSGTPNLEKLFFNDCESVIHIHESVGQLKKLVELSLRRCTNLKSLPTPLDMDNLEVFILDGCFNLEKLPEFSKGMRRLYFLDVRSTKITEIPSSIINLENLKYLDLSWCWELQSIPELPPNSIIRAETGSTLDLQHLVELRVSKHPIHLVIDSKVKEVIPPWFEQQEHRYSKDASGEVVTITADVASDDLANSEGIAVYIIFECLSDEEAWTGFAINWKFEDDPHNTNDKKKGGRPQHRARADASSQVDSTAKIKCRVYRGFFPIDKEKCRQHPSGVGSQVDLTLCFPTTNIGKVIIHSEETSFGDFEIVDCGWRLVCKRDLDASSASIRHEVEIAECWQPKKQKEIVEDIPAQGEEIAEDSAKLVGKKLDDEIPSNFEHLVGDTQSKVDEIISLLKMELDNDPRFIRISGESGIGKTTLARLVYDAIQSKFDATCFLENVREDSERFGIVSLQKKLLSELGLGERDVSDFSEGAKIIRKFLCHKKVLIILDDVSEKSQLENLAGNKEWFGAGSKIVIITTGNMSTLDEQPEECQVGRLRPDESLQLLHQEAFKKDKPEQVYLDLSEELVKYVCGLPLVLKVLGSFLFQKKEYEWRNASERLRQNSPIDISSALRISYDELEDEECKRIFLDIACFFNREVKFKVINMLESLCGPHSVSGIKVLIEKSMLNFIHSNSDIRQTAKEDQDMLDKVQKMRRDIFLPTHLYDWLLQEASKEYLYMHDLLQTMGREIIYQESPNAGRRSRLWSRDDIDNVLKENEGTGNVQSIVLYIQQHFDAEWHPDCFSNMQNLTLLELSKAHLTRNLNSLPSALKIMRWDYYDLESLPPVDQSRDLESLQLRCSKITRLWEGAPELHKLRTIDLSHSDDLRETPDFSGTPNLEELLLNGCRKLVKVHESAGQLKNLVKLTLKECRRLEILPTKLETDKLAEFILNGCLKLEKLPEFSENMGSLYFVDVKGTDITEIPQSIIHLTILKYLDLTYCSRLKSMPELPPNVIIYASNCDLLEPTSALRHLHASCSPKGPIHLFYDFQLWTRIPTWFERWEYCWGKDTTGEFVTITADLPSNVVAGSNKERWGIAVCVVFQFLSQAWLGFSIDWKFKDCHPKKTKIHGTPLYYVHDCRVYVGFYPFDANDNYRQDPSPIKGGQLDLTLDFPKANIINGLHDLKIMGCGWRLACKKDFDEWSESRAPSPPRLGFFNR